MTQHMIICAKAAKYQDSRHPPVYMIGIKMLTSVGGCWRPKVEALIYSRCEKLNEKGLSSIKISAMDETSVDTFMTNWNAYDAATKANVGQMNTHTYSGSNRHIVRDAAKAAGKPLWMSEVDLGPSGIAHDHDNIDPALALAERIMTDITWLEPQAWVVW
jgi:O-glycosyl hydrolase